MTGSAPDDTVVPYRRIAETLRSRIRSGQWPPGHRVPSQPDLAIEFGVARATVQSALRLLAATGLIVARQGAGTFVTDTPPADDNVPVIRVHRNGRTVAIRWPGLDRWMLVHRTAGDQTAGVEWQDTLDEPTDLGEASAWTDPAAVDDTPRSRKDGQAANEFQTALAHQTALIRQEMQRGTRAIERALARIERTPLTDQD